jgi:arginyl-tRNA synthetase
VISSDVRRAVRDAAAAAGLPPGADPGLRPTGVPGQYAASAALALGGDTRASARGLAAALAGVPWIEKAEVTGPGYLTITVAATALAAVADRIAQAGPQGCAASDALAGMTVSAPPPGDPLAAATWEAARAALAARLTARLAAAAGATVAEPQDTERRRPTRPARRSATRPDARQAAASAEIAAAVTFAGRDAVTFALARAIPGKPLRVEPEIIARHVVDNPAYAVRYAHARAASGVRWALASLGDDPPYPIRGDTGQSARETESAPRPPADPGELALLDALSWLPERVAVAARRGRPDEFARYLEELAHVTVDVLSAVSHPGHAAAPGSDRLTLARAARAGLAAGLGLLEVSAPERL